MQGPAGWPPQGQQNTQHQPAGWPPQGQEDLSSPGGAQQQPAQAQVAPGSQPGSDGQADDDVAPGMREVSCTPAVPGLV